jgi:hypothetical protein
LRANIAAVVIYVIGPIAVALTVEDAGIISAGLVDHVDEFELYDLAHF